MLEYRVVHRETGTVYRHCTSIQPDGEVRRTFDKVVINLDIWEVEFAVTETTDGERVYEGDQVLTKGGQSGIARKSGVKINTTYLPWDDVSVTLHKVKLWTDIQVGKYFRFKDHTKVHRRTLDGYDLLNIGEQSCQGTITDATEVIELEIIIKEGSC